MKKLKNAARLLKKVGYNDDLLHHGFKRIIRNGSMSFFLYINKDTRIVIKNSFLTKKNIPSFAIPTIFVRNSEPDCEHMQYFLIQPLADVSRGREAKKIIARKHQKEIILKSLDFQAANLGFYRNKAVAIDW